MSTVISVCTIIKTHLKSWSYYKLLTPIINPHQYWFNDKFILSDIDRQINGMQGSISPLSC
jgi:hypothetical protein